jgi:predicted nucleic acid-binding protein
MNPSVYVETSVIGYLTSWPRQDVTIAGHQNTTKQWWSTAGDRFELFVSQLVVRECSDGDSTAVQERLVCIEGLPVLPITVDAENLAASLIQGSAVPASEPNDALHIALAAVHGVQYLVSWNFRHIVNASLRPAIERVCRDAGYDPPVMCTPEELGEGSDDQ